MKPKPSHHVDPVPCSAWDECLKTWASPLPLPRMGACHPGKALLAQHIPRHFYSGGAYNESSGVGFLPPVFRLSSVQHSKGPKAAAVQHRSLCQCWQEEENV